MKICRLRCSTCRVNASCAFVLSSEELGPRLVDDRRKARGVIGRRSDRDPHQVHLEPIIRQGRAARSDQRVVGRQHPIYPKIPVKNFLGLANKACHHHRRPVLPIRVFGDLRGEIGVVGHGASHALKPDGGAYLRAAAVDWSVHVPLDV